MRERRFEVFTCDLGRRPIDVDRDAADHVQAVLQEVIESGFWRELDKFPTDVIARLAPRLTIPRSTRRLLEIWIDERPDAA